MHTTPEAQREALASAQADLLPVADQVRVAYARMRAAEAARDSRAARPQRTSRHSITVLLRARRAYLQQGA
jgi:hypothetical protein